MAGTYFLDGTLASISCYISGLSTQDVTGLASAAANLIMAAGVVFAAKSLRVQKRIHLVDLHNKFQFEIRRIQEKMPTDINERCGSFTKAEHRVIRMYWYAVFDEWMTCKYRSNDPELNQIWEYFAWGAKSAIDKLPIFAYELVDLRRVNPYLLGTHDKFFQEVELFCRSRYRKADVRVGILGGRKELKCALLFGVPCSGKSSVIKELKDRDWVVLQIDPIVEACVKNGGYFAKIDRQSFVQHAESVCLDLYKTIIELDRENPVVIELGCLLPKAYAERLVAMLALVSVGTVCFKLEISESEAKRRAIERNLQIRDNKSSALPIDDPDKMEVFFSNLKNNLPDNVIKIDMLNSDPKKMAKLISKKTGVSVACC